MGWTVYNSDGQILQSAGVSDNAITTAKILDDAVTVAKLANSINTDIDANTAKTGITSGQASAITANTAKVTNATHTGEVTGITGLTITPDAVTNAKLANMAANTIKVNATTGSANPTDISMASANLSGAIADDDVLLMYDTSTTSLKTVAKSVLVAGLNSAGVPKAKVSSIFEAYTTTYSRRNTITNVAGGTGTYDNIGIELNTSSTISSSSKIATNVGSANGIEKDSPT